MAVLGTSKHLRVGWVLLKIVSSGKHSSSMAAMVSTYVEGPRAPNQIAEADQGPSVRGGWSLRRGQEHIEFLENKIAAMSYCRTLNGGIVGSTIPRDCSTPIGTDLSKSVGCKATVS